jgi:hypothetical protein
MEREERLTEESAQVAGTRRQSRQASKAEPSRRASTRVDAREDERNQDEREDGEAFEQLSDDERFDLFADSLDTSSVLPDLPPMPGFHVCWLTTTHQSDTVAKRLRLGYQLIRAEDLGQNWSSTSLKTGEYAGCVAINEMIAAKIPTRLWNRYMQRVHHELPLSEEEKLRSAIDQMKDDADQRGARLDEGDAMAGIVRRAPVPNFAR